MPDSGDAIQRLVHALEAGGLAVWIKRALVGLAIAVLSLIYLGAFPNIYQFRGLATSQAMDQAQIGREIASGHGWRTKLIRPRAVGQLQNNGRNVAQKIWYDTYNAPLPPLVNAIALLPVKSYWQMTPRDVVYTGDKAIAFVSILLFIGSVIVLFFVARRLFDQRLALLACGLLLICDTIWQYSLSGLPQMLLLFLFNLTTYFLVRAVQAQYEGTRVTTWLLLSGVGFGLLALTHALTIWIFVAAVIFGGFFFRPRGRAVLVLVAAFAILYAPWLVRNFAVCGDFGGVAIYSALNDIRQSEAAWMRRVSLDLEGITPGFFRNKFVGNFTQQFDRLFEYLGWSVVAPIFFVSLLHSFKRSETAMLRWLILSMWAGAVLGMAIYGLEEEQGVVANQLHLLFIPLMTCYGLAFLLVLWNRLEIDLRIARIGFLTLLFVLCSWPMVSILFLSAKRAGVRWPPYVPPYIAVLNGWMKPNEITASDMPWAIAWYADRPAIWLPENVRAFTDFNDYRVFNAPLNGLYLTPISGSRNTLNEILKGEYKEWGAVILRSVDLQKFPLKWATLLGFDGECTFFSDHDRQKTATNP